MQRRDFLKGAGAGLAASSLAACAKKEGAAATGGLPSVRWRLASSYPKSLDTIYGAAEVLAKRVEAVTNGKFQIRVHAGGEIVPGLQVLDAVQQGTVDCGHTASYYYVGKNMAFAFDCAVPFGLTARQQNAWMYYGGGRELMAELFKQYNIVSFPGGNTGVQMGGWFRKEIKSLADLNGLKMRIPGIGGQIMAKLGAVPQTLAGSDIYPALERGAIDAAEWVGPYDDEKLGFAKIAKHYYYPGWWEGGPQLSFYVNAAKWQALPEPYRQAFETACVEANMTMLAAYDTKNPQALGRLIGAGVQLHAFPDDVMAAARRLSFEMYEAETAHNPAFKKIYESWKAFRETELEWFKLAEASYTNFLFSR
ncbi:ABC transporter substrate-binding protein [Parasulfuritortus cantonensis]|uniref:ABC transporter substrate-binding protein n=1 Tax=Parasulfuritortus cantonensis TaxID=2528202 RepID=A0A4R1BFM7_9PROT|nr:TRAP transporter substrate-binding protein [Parasulfuritortus cantonensis]TCJ15971.1 ABC transporter substrate-binding protein [Parasulfuritortus cantonensis]